MLHLCSLINNDSPVWLVQSILFVLRSQPTNIKVHSLIVTLSSFMLNVELHNLLSFDLSQGTSCANMKWPFLRYD